MKRSTGFAGVALPALFFLLPANSYCWGFQAHQMIAAAALEILPTEMKSAILPYRETIVAQSHAPDTWRQDPAERSRHYVDLEMGDTTGYPFSRFPRDYTSAVAQLGADSLRKMGTLPWHIAAYREKAVTSLLHPTDSTLVMLAALGHYVADAYMPLHLTVNYDGQLTGNRGVHLRFEWWALDRNARSIHLAPVFPSRIDDPLAAVWQIALNSYADIDTILRADAGVRHAFRPPIDTPEGRRQADPPYDQLLWDRIGWLAAYRMNLAAQGVAGFWYEAWLAAGKPRLDGLSALPAPPLE